jgi:PPP family 3-phenylpropionic acid transporter
MSREDPRVRAAHAAPSPARMKRATTAALCREGSHSVSLAVRLSLFYAALFGVVGVFLPFWPVWLESRGITAAEIGILLAAGQWVKVISNPAVAQWVDRRGSRRDVLRALTGISCLVFALFAVAHGFWPLLLFSLLASSLHSPVIPLSDNLTLLAIRGTGVDYARVRAWGSIAFIATATGGGWLLAGQPPDVILWLLLAGIAGIAATTWLLPDPRTPPSDRRTPKLRPLLRDTTFRLFLLVGSLIAASHAAYYGFASLHWLANGLDADTVGLLWAEGVLAEIVLFAVAGRLFRNVDPGPLFALACACGVLRWGCLGLTTALPVLVAAQALHAFTFGAAHLAAMRFIADRLPPELSASGQSLYAAVIGGIAMGLTMPLSGLLYDAAAGGAFLVMATMAGLGIPVALALRSRAIGVTPARA